MSHVADAGFYEEVKTRIRRCGLAIVEGAERGGRLRHKDLVRALGRSGHLDRLGLVRQDIDGEKIEHLGVPTVRPDMTADAFNRAWRRLPIRYRAYNWAFSTAFMFPPLRRRIDRRAIAGSGLDRELSVDEAALCREWARLGSRLAMMRERDELLVEALNTVHRHRADESIDVAVVYGAAHMPAVILHLQGLGYEATSSDWLTVYSLDRPG